jgi:hypothetical protein
MISYMISFQNVIVMVDIAYDITNLVVTHSLYMGRMGDERGIDVHNYGNRNCSRSKLELCQFKTQRSIGITAQHPLPIRICAELESKMLTPRHALI